MSNARKLSLKHLKAWEVLRYVWQPSYIESTEGNWDWGPLVNKRLNSPPDSNKLWGPRLHRAREGASMEGLCDNEGFVGGGRRAAGAEDWVDGVGVGGSPAYIAWHRSPNRWLLSSKATGKVLLYIQHGQQSKSKETRQRGGHQMQEDGEKTTSFPSE